MIETELADFIAGFIKENSNEIDNNEFEKVYNKLNAYPETYLIKPRLTELLIAAGIDPLLYMDKVPANYALGLNIKSIKTPYGIKLIQSHAFSDCTELTEVDLSDSIIRIDDSCFENCQNLRHIKLSANLSVIGSNSFNHCESLEKIDLPETLKYIDEKAFASCTSLTTLVIPDSVVDLEWSVFADCEQLTSVSIGSGVYYISPYCFSNCSSLETVKISKSVKSIGAYAFRVCGDLSEIIYDGTMAEWKAIDKEDTWCPKKRSQELTIQCTDGEIYL